jgi:CubicO group peptidase (beta-lactamase class C family)
VRRPPEPKTSSDVDDTGIDELFGDRARYGTTYALVVVRDGAVVAERYDGALPHADGSGTPVGADTPLLSWSMSKSVLHAAVGILVGRGRLDPHAPAPVAAWQGAGDPRRAITLDQLLAMRDGLAFVEDYVDGSQSSVIAMLFGAGKDDVARYAAACPLAHEPGAVFNYSSGTSNVVARIAQDAIGGGREGTERFLREELFGPLGMASAHARFDAAGNWIASSFVYATARDFARFGELYLHDGVWNGRRLVPEGWVAHGTIARSVQASDGRHHGAHWWVEPALGAFYASGYAG